MSTPLLAVAGLRVGFPAADGRRLVLRGIDFEVAEGTAYGIVGESGCGKSMTAHAILGLVPPPGSIVGGTIAYRGQDLVSANPDAWAGLRGRHIAMVHQDPSAALNPLFTVGSQIRAIMRRHGRARARETRERAVSLLGELELADPAALLDRYPHELSGGMQQRVLLAMALAGDPDLVIADEATTALDVTIQAQVLALLDRLRRKRGLTLVIITHDLGVVAQTCDRVAVLYLGRIVEEGDPADIFLEPHHPYTRGLLKARPGERTQRTPLAVIPGSVPADATNIEGCAFRERCAFAMACCRIEDPAVRRLSDRHRSACHLEGEG